MNASVLPQHPMLWSSMNLMMVLVTENALSSLLASVFFSCRGAIGTLVGYESSSHFCHQ